MTTVRYLGGTTLFPPIDEDAPCVLINDRLMVDTGYIAAQRMLSFGLHVGMIDHLLITHYHPDHTIGLPMIISNRNGYSYVDREVRPMTIFGPEESIERLLHNTFQFLDLPDDFQAGTVVPMKPGESYEDDAFAITAHGATHPEPGRLYRVRDKATSTEIGLSWDTSYDRSNGEFFHGVDLLIHDVTHTTAEDAARTAVEADASRLFLIHSSNKAKSLNEARTVYPDAEFPVDGTVMEI